MAVTFSRTATVLADGNATQVTQTETGAESSKVSISVDAGKSGSLTTRTDADTGIVTSAAHGLTTADRVSVFWTNTDGTAGYRANMEITGTTTDTLSVDGGVGDDLPAAATSVIVGKVAYRVVAWEGTYNGMLGFMGTVGNRRGTITAQEVGTLGGIAGTDLVKHLPATSPGYLWLDQDGAFAFTGDILFLSAALGDVNGAAIATFVGLDT